MYIYIYIYIYNNFPQKVLELLHFESFQNRINSVNLVGEIQFKLSKERVLTTGEPFSRDYVTIKIPSFMYISGVNPPLHTLHIKFDVAKGCSCYYYLHFI